MHHQPRRSESERKKIASLYGSGLATAAIRERFGLTKEALETILAEHGVTRRKVGKRHSYQPAAGEP